MAKRILVADDSVTIQKAFAMTFAAEDVTLAFARSADEGLSVARQVQPDLVIADAVMPGRSGYDLCAALKADRALSGIPVYILASSQNPFDEGRGRQVGADGHLLKPFDSIAIIDRVHDVLGKADGAAGIVSSSVGGRSNYSPPSMGGIPVPPPGPDYGDDDYGEITIDSVPARDAPRPAPVAAPPPSVPSYVPAIPAPAFAPPPPVAAPGFTARPASAPSSTAPAFGPGLRPSLIPGARPGLAPAARPGIVPSSNAPAARTLAPPAGPAAHAPVPSTPTLRPASIPTARTMVGMPVPRPGLSMPVPSPPARPGTGPLRTLAQPSPAAAPAHVPAPVAPPPQAHVPMGTGLVDQKVAEIAARGPEYEVLAKMSREVIEKIVWEIVPELTEAIVREELQRRGRA